MRLGLNQSFFSGDAGGIPAAADMQFGQNIPQMSFHGMQRKRQPAGNFFIRITGSHQAKNFLFSLGKLRVVIR